MRKCPACGQSAAWIMDEEEATIEADEHGELPPAYCSPDCEDRHAPHDHAGPQALLNLEQPCHECNGTGRHVVPEGHQWSCDGCGGTGRRPTGARS